MIRTYCEAASYMWAAIEHVRKNLQLQTRTAQVFSVRLKRAISCDFKTRLLAPAFTLTGILNFVNVGSQKSLLCLIAGLKPRAGV